MEKDNRTLSVDIAKGILIILVVVAHAQTDIVHDIIFMFHMPLFFRNFWLSHETREIIKDWICERKD